MCESSMGYAAAVACVDAHKQSPYSHPCALLEMFENMLFYNIFILYMSKSQKRALFKLHTWLNIKIL